MQQMFHKTTVKTVISYILLFIISILKSEVGYSQKPPNIIFIMSDDHDNDAISAYNKNFIVTPNIDRLASEGALFTKAFVGNSICSPSRATLLTGQHSHKNGVINNFIRFDSSKTTLAHLLTGAGYNTAVIGKWHLHSYPQGFTYWKILPGMGQYFDTRIINMLGDTVVEKGYSTDVITNNAIQYLSSVDKSKPFALLLHHKAPHRNFIPKLEHLKALANKKFPAPATLFADTSGRGTAWYQQTMSILYDMRLCGDLKIDPKYLEGIEELKPNTVDIATYKAIINRLPVNERDEFLKIFAERGKIIAEQKPTGHQLLAYKYQWYMQDYLACISAIDDGVGKVLDYLKESQLENNTLVVYCSDQGFYLGENGWFDKRFAYDVSMGTPLLMRWPGVIKPGCTINTMVQNIDFAPTLLDVAGAQVPQWMQGVSLKKLISGNEQTLKRNALYYHYYEFSKDHTVIPHIAMRTDRFKLIYFYTVNEWQLYDLVNDPAEQKNIYATINSQIRNQLVNELRELRKKYEDTSPAGVL